MTRTALPVVLACAALVGCDHAVPSRGHTHATRIESKLDALFPSVADRILRAGSPIARTGKGFELPAPSGDGPIAAAERSLVRRSRVDAAFPHDGGAPVVLAIGDGATVRVTEVGGEGSVRVAERAAIVPRATGASFWHTRGAGWESWVLLEGDEPGTRRVSWHVDGATLRQHGRTVDVVGDDGRALLAVEAPLALAENGRELAVDLRAEGAELVAEVDAPRGAVLVDPTWAPVGSMVTGRWDHTATLLPNGKVLVTGGYLANATTEIYDPQTGKWKAGPAMATERNFHTATLLPDGKVIIAGGRVSLGGGLDSTDLYDFSTNTITAGPTLQQGRYGHGATRLVDGRVVFVGGTQTAGADVVRTEVYDPATGFTRFDDMNIGRTFVATSLLPATNEVLVVGDSETSPARFDPAATPNWKPAGTVASHNILSACMMTNGKVLLVGRSSSPTFYAIFDPVSNGWSGTAVGPQFYAPEVSLQPDGKMLVLNPTSGNVDAHIYDPVGDTWAGPTTLGSTAHGTDWAGTLLPNGDVLVVGGGISGLDAEVHVFDRTVPTWGAGSAPAPRRALSATPLANGTLLLAGGDDTSGALSTAAIYSPVNDGVSAVGVAMPSARTRHTATLLADGRVLLAGGSDGAQAVGTTVLFDPTTSTWTPGASLTGARDGHTATLLASGKVLVAGGTDATGAVVATTEVYDPGADAWTPGADLGTTRSGHTATLLRDGRVLAAGGTDGTAAQLASVEIYVPASDAWMPAHVLSQARADHAASLLPNGGVLVTGGIPSAAPLGQAAEVYTVATDVWSTTSTMNAPRKHHTSTLLVGGAVLVAGGDDGTGPLPSAEAYHPDTGLWVSLSTGLPAHSRHVAALLPNGKAYVAGGDGAAALATTASRFDEGRGAQAAWTPTLALPAKAAIGSSVSLTGTHFRGVSEAGFGNTHGSATNHPILYLDRIEGRVMTPIGPIAVTDTSATALLTAAGLMPGWHRAWVVVSGVPSNAVSILLTGALGAPCTLGADCGSGFCADGVCCDSPCTTGDCDACSMAKGASADGTCTSLDLIPCGDSCLTGSSTCNLGVCAGTGSPKPDGSTCPGGSCQAGTCVPSSSSSSSTASSSASSTSTSSSTASSSASSTSTSSSASGSGNAVATGAGGAGGGGGAGPVEQSTFRSCTCRVGEQPAAPWGAASLGLALGVFTARRRARRR